MPFIIEIFPSDRLVIQTFFGDITLEENKKAHAELVSHPDYDDRFCGVTDFRRAKKVYSKDEIREIQKDAESIDLKSRWCSLELNPKNTALALLFNSTLECSSKHSVFTTVDEASAFLQKPDLPKCIRSISDTHPEIGSL
jgi:hypothetical protein